MLILKVKMGDFFWYQNIYSNGHFKKTIGNKTQIYHVLSLWTDLMWTLPSKIRTAACIILVQTLELDCHNDACSYRIETKYGMIGSKIRSTTFNMRLSHLNKQPCHCDY